MDIKLKFKTMQYIQLDNFNGNLSTICKDNETGEHLIFDTLQEAENTLKENYQNGQIIPLSIDIIKLLRSCGEFVGDGYEEGLIDEQLTADLDRILDLK